jgi:hypothetical protein
MPQAIEVEKKSFTIPRIRIELERKRNPSTHFLKQNISIINI